MYSNTEDNNASAFDRSLYARADKGAGWLVGGHKRAGKKELHLHGELII